jgi:hypothetical protein
MKRGAGRLLLALVAAIALAHCAFAANQSIGVFLRSQGDNWTVDGHDLRIVLREQQDPGLIYLTFDNETMPLARFDCAGFQNYRVCFENSTLGPRFNPELKTTPYVYYLHITALTATVSATLSVRDTILLVGQDTSVRLDVANTGSIDIAQLEMRLKAPDFAVTELAAPCTLQGNTVIYQGALAHGDDVSCDFTLTPVNRTKATLQPVINFTDGRKRQIVNGASVVIDARTSIVSIRLANATVPLGGVMKGMIDINNTYTDQSLMVTGSLSAPLAELRGVTTYQNAVGSKSSIGLPFEVRFIHPGNISVSAVSTIMVGSETTHVTDTRTARVLFPLLKLKIFGQTALATAGNANIQIEVQNLGDIALHNVSLRLWPPVQLSMPTTGSQVELPPNRNEQIYVTTVNVPFNNTLVLIPLNVTLTTDYGDRLTLNSNVTIRVGKAAAKLLPTTKPTQPATTKPATPTKPATAKPAAGPGAAVTGNLNTFLVIIIIALIAGAAFWFLSMARLSRGPKAPEGGFE